MRLHQKFLTNNDCYKAGRKITVKGLMLHSTGANNPKLSRYIPDGAILGTPSTAHWDQPKPGGRLVCVHSFIGKDKDNGIRTYQTLPWNHRGWGGGGSSNDTHIHVEICEDGLTDATYFNAVYREAVELFAYLCRMFNLNPLKDITCHSEGYRAGIASNHADVMHWFPKHGKSMDTFRADVNKMLTQPKEEEDMLEKAVCYNSLADIGIAEFLAAKLSTVTVQRVVAEKVKVAKELIIVGGTKDGLKADKFTVLSGPDRFATTAEVNKYLAK